jgi:ferredoxin
MTAPRVFDQREDDGVVDVLSSDPAAADWDGVRLAASNCPVGAIHIADDEDDAATLNG